MTTRSAISLRSALAPVLLCLALLAPATGQDLTADIQKSIAETVAAAKAAGFSPAELARYKRVIEFAREAHHGQVRSGGKPAILHALRISQALLKGSPGDRVAVEAAVLHDVVEDTKVGIEKIRAAFGPKTAEIVQWVTLDPIERFRGDKVARDKAYYERFRTAPKSAHVLKYFDRLDNVRDMRGWEVVGKLGYLQATREQVIESLRPRSPELAAKLEASVNKLTAKYQTELARKAGLLDRYRRADKTLRWKTLLRDRVLVEEGSGLARFTLALFLKELAVVMHTGDKLRIGEFFDGLASTDFFVHYGLFAVGARAGEVAYARYLQAHVRPRFVSNLLKSNLALAAGLALPQLATGTFDGERFAVSLTALGLASTAVRTQLSALRWVGARSSRLTRLGLTFRRAGRLGSFAYTVAETTIVLIAADAIERQFNAWKDARAAREALGEAGLTLIEAFAKNPKPDAVAAAVATYGEAWDAYRAWLLTPLQDEEARLMARMAKLGERAKVLADKHRASLERLERTPALKARLLARYGSLEAWAAAREESEREEIAADAGAAIEANREATAKALRDIYAAKRRPHVLLTELDLSEARWLRAGLGVRHDLYGGRTDRLAAWGRSRLRSALGHSLGGASKNRAQTYEDQALVLDLAAALLRKEDRRLLDPAKARLRRQAALDAHLGSSAGLTGALRDR
ncbi:MAG: bifunctional (p)ppGpp synthetase/guanosine-3',5'-bis(diphosphate) 3'-pyrophosphohydrolase [Planctomycetes bacterium]|nr:bifunctional (p)ppGpp synthetase/guanosine-3',5'-bis(diphosphate) 3'-pyrophosphohydrolase [Planctomycetota bacterium]